MYGELGAIKGIVDLSPEHALDEAEAFLASLDSLSCAVPRPPLLPKGAPRRRLLERLCLT
jgi:hypothetical protein